MRGEVSPTTFEAGMNRSVVNDALKIPLKTTETALKGTAKTGEFV